MNAILAFCVLACPVYLAAAATVGESCSSSSSCVDENAICKSVSACAESKICVCKFGFLWNGDNCLHMTFLKTGLACKYYSDCMGAVLMDPLTSDPTLVVLGHQCISNRCVCATNYGAFGHSAWSDYGWAAHVCVPTTTTSTTTTTSSTSTTTAPTTTTTTSTTSTSTTSTSTSTTTTTTPTTTTSTSTTTLTTTLLYRQYGEKCWDFWGGGVGNGCDPRKGLLCDAGDTCSTDVSTSTYYCYCPSGYKYCPCSGCKKIDFGDKCNSTAQCSHLSFGFCNDDGVCDGLQPTTAMAVGVMCDSTLPRPCDDRNAICRPHDECDNYDFCQCKWNYFHNGYKCLPRSYLKVGQACSTDMDCFSRSTRDPRDFSQLWTYWLGHKCRKGACRCEDSYEPVEAKWYSDTYSKFSIPYDVCTYRPTTTTTTTTTTTSTTPTDSTSTSTSTTTTTTTSTSTTTTPECPTTPTSSTATARATTTTTTRTTTPPCPAGQEWRSGLCWTFLSWGQQCYDVSWQAGQFDGVCDPLKNLVCADNDQCSLFGSSARSCSCRRGYKRSGSGCRKIELGDSCNSTTYCNNVIDGGFCGDDGRCYSVHSAGLTARPWGTPLLLALALLVCRFK